MSTYIPTYTFSLDRNEINTTDLYGGKFYDILERALSQKDIFNTRSYNFRGEAHIGALLYMCKREKLSGLDFIGHELSVIADYQLNETQTSLEKLIKIIESSIKQNDIDRLTPLTSFCYHTEEDILIEDVRNAYSRTGDLSNVAPYSTGGDEGINVLLSIFDYIKSLNEIVGYCIDKKYILVNFHHPA